MYAGSETFVGRSTILVIRHNCTTDWIGCFFTQLFIWINLRLTSQYVTLDGIRHNSQFPWVLVLHDKRIRRYTQVQRAPKMSASLQVTQEVHYRLHCYWWEK